MTKKLVLLIIFLAICNLPYISNAAQQQWGAAYLDWSGALLSKDSSISQIIQPLEISSNIYWESGWHWDNIPDGGYGGIQASGYLANGEISDLAIFSIWNAINAVPGPEGGCLPFGGEGVGFSCRVKVDLKAGNRYELNFSTDKSRGDNWWVASVKEIDRGITKIVGSIETKYFNAKASNWNNFIEYWGQEVPCNAVGLASAKFYTPKSSNEMIEIHSPTFSRPANPCAMSAGETPPKGMIGDAIIRFGGPVQKPSTETMPFTKTKAQIAAEAKAEAEAKAKAEAEAKAKAEAEAKAKAEAEAKAKLLTQISKKITITCYKGKITRKITAIKPVCPAGFKKKA